jgi:hypothetical protein
MIRVPVNPAKPSIDRTASVDAPTRRYLMGLVCRGVRTKAFGFEPLFDVGRDLAEASLLFVPLPPLIFLGLPLCPLSGPLLFACPLSFPAAVVLAEAIYL